MTRIMPKPNDENVSSAPSTSSGLFRGFLSNVGSTVLGVGDSLSKESDVSTKFRILQDELQVLREELESKIAENERLVMDCCDIRRESKEWETKYSKLESTLVGCNRERDSLESRVNSLEAEKYQMEKDVHNKDVKIHELTKELELQGESVTKYKGIASTLSMERSESLARISGLETDFARCKDDLMKYRAECEQSARSLDSYEKEMREQEAEITRLKIEREVNKSRIEQLEEDLRVASILGSTTSRDGVCSYDIIDEMGGSVPPCKGSLILSPCCHRSEYYRDKCKNMEYKLKASKVLRTSSSVISSGLGY